jgi:hypothetical protein
LGFGCVRALKPEEGPRPGVVAGLEAVAAWRVDAEAAIGPDAGELRVGLSRALGDQSQAEAALSQAEAAVMAAESARARAAQELARATAHRGQAAMALDRAKQRVLDLEPPQRAGTGDPQALNQEEDRRTRVAIQQGMQVDRALLVARGELVTRALQTRALQMAGIGGRPGIVGASNGDGRPRGWAGDRSAVGFAESDDGAFSELGAYDALGVETGHLSPGIQRAIARRQQGAAAKLLPHLLAAEADADPIDAELAPVAVVASLEPITGPPTALQLLLPVPATVWSDPARHGDSLVARLAWRIVAALAVALRDCDADDAPIRFASDNDNLSIQVWLADAEVRGDVKDALSAGFDRINEESGELRAANVELYVAWLDPDMIVGSEEGGDG